MEVIAIDPMLGPVFYSFDSNRRDGTAPRFVRDSDCLRCHGGAFVRDIPAVFARSVFPDNRGEPLLRFGSQIVDDHTPFTERWGGGTSAADMARPLIEATSWLPIKAANWSSIPPRGRM